MQFSDLDPAVTLVSAERALRAQREAEAQVLGLAAHWADLHPDVGIRVDEEGFRERPVRLGGAGTPKVMEFAPAELALVLELHPLGARSLTADALDLRHRLPHLWALVHRCMTPVWVARKVAKMTRDLTPAEVAVIDARIAGDTEDAVTLPPSRLLGLVEAMVLAAQAAQEDEERDDAMAQRFVTVSAHKSRRGTTGVYGCVDDAGGRLLEDTITRLAGALADAGDTDRADVRRAKALVLLGTPALALRFLLGVGPVPGDGDDLPTDESESDEAVLARLLASVPVEKLAPSVVLYLHLSDRTLFSADPASDGPVRWEGVGPITRTHLLDLLDHANVTVRPVWLPAEHRPSDAYEYSGRLREAVVLTVPVDCYPYAVAPSRGLDVDHTIAYDPDGPPGQTSLANAGPMTRHHHRLKTHGRMRVRQPRPGTYVWRTPHRHHRMTNRSGTHRIKPLIGEAIHGPSAMEAALASLLV